MTMNVATRSSGTPPLIPPGGRHRSLRFGNSGRRVASAAAAVAAAATDEPDDAELAEETDDREPVAGPDAPHEPGICDEVTI